MIDSYGLAEARGDAGMPTKLRQSGKICVFSVYIREGDGSSLQEMAREAPGAGITAVEMVTALKTGA